MRCTRLRSPGMYQRIGVVRPRGLGRCGLCGQQRLMTQAHVPPRAVGNDGRHRERALWVQGQGGARLSGWRPGGLTVYGLCSRCNHSTSDRADVAYLDFHRRLKAALSSTSQRLLLDPRSLPVRLSPGLVARSVLSGLFAVNDRMHEHYPALAAGLRDKQRDLALPPQLQLRLAVASGTRSRIGGPVGYARVFGRRAFHLPLAEVWFPPMAWVLRTAGPTDPSVGEEFTAAWGDATEWIRYQPELTTDLRNLTGPLPRVQPPQFGADDWLILTGEKAMAAVEGRPRRSGSRA